MKFKCFVTKKNIIQVLFNNKTWIILIILICYFLFECFLKNPLFFSGKSIVEDIHNTLTTPDQILKDLRLQPIDSIDFMDYITPKNFESSTQKKILKKNDLTLFEANKRMEFIKNQTASSTSSILKIPQIWHKIWVTNSDDPCEIPKEILQRISLMCDLFSDWHHYLWTNVNGIVEESFIRNNLIMPKNFSEKNISEFKHEKLFPIVDTFIKLKDFAHSTDFLRVLVIYKYGGAYTDIGWIINNHVFEKLVKYCYVIDGHGPTPGLVSHTCIAAYPKSKLFANIIKHAEEISETFSFRYKSKVISSVSHHSMTGWAPISVFPDETLYLFDPEKYAIRFHSGSHYLGRYGASISNNISSFVFVYYLLKYKLLYSGNI